MKFIHKIASMLAVKYGFDITMPEEILAGLIEGLIAKDDLPEIQKCLTNGETLEKEFETVIADLEKKDIGDIIKAAQEVGVIIAEIPTDLANCKETTADLQKIATWAKQFTNPIKLVETLTTNLLMNWSSVQADIAQLTTDQAAKKYYAVGEDIADITVAALGKISLVRQFEQEAHDEVAASLH